GGQCVTNAVQRFADSSDVAVSEDRPDALDETLTVLGHLNAEPLHHGLCGGQPDLLVHATSSRAPARSLSQIRQSRAYLAAMISTAASSEILPASQSRAAWPKIVRPTAKPFTSGCPAAKAKLAANSSSGASRPSTTMPLVRGSLRSMASTALAQASFVLNGSSFHQSG